MRRLVYLIFLTLSMACHVAHASHYLVLKPTSTLERYEVGAKKRHVELKQSGKELLLNIEGREVKILSESPIGQAQLATNQESPESIFVIISCKADAKSDSAGPLVIEVKNFIVVSKSECMQ